MNLFGWLGTLFDEADSACSASGIWEPSVVSMDDDISNPANGLPMIGGFAGVDTEGNLYGADFSSDSMWNGCSDSCSSDIAGDW